MPYRHAHWWIAALFPLIAVAFWPNYLGQYRSAPFALHAHGTTAACWLALLAVQSWSIHARRVDWHRAAGLATFVALPLFAAAGPLALWSMVELHVTQADPFHAAYGARLAFADMISGPVVIALVVYAFAQRRKVRTHAAAMLATAIMVLPPILARLTSYVPGFPTDGAWGMTGFELSFQITTAVALVVAIVLARPPAARSAFGFTALAALAHMIGFATFTRAEAWDAIVRRMILLPVAPVAFVTGAGTFGLLWWAWGRVPPRRGTATGAVPAAA